MPNLCNTFWAARCSVTGLISSANFDVRNTIGSTTMGLAETITITGGTSGTSEGGKCKNKALFNGPGQGNCV
jgi:hypothetical protein